MIETRVLDIGRQPYENCLNLMRALVEAKYQGDWPEVLIVVEHEPVFTLGRRGTEDDVLAPKPELAARGITMHKIERGGLVTYHGPGQVVAYPIFNLKKMRLGISQLVRSLEEVVISACQDFGVAAGRQEGHPGVWANGFKLASIGLAVRHGITFHGIALNNNPDLSHFALINPCGLEAQVVTSLEKMRGAAVEPDQLRASLLRHFSRVLDLRLIPWTLDQALATLEEHGGISAQTGLAEA